LILALAITEVWLRNTQQLLRQNRSLVQDTVVNLFLYAVFLCLCVYFCPVASEFPLSSAILLFFMFCHEERHILPRSGRVHRETYEKYDRFDGELVSMAFS